MPSGLKRDRTLPGQLAQTPFAQRATSSRWLQSPRLECKTLGSPFSPLFNQCRNARMAAGPRVLEWPAAAASIGRQGTLGCPRYCLGCMLGCIINLSQAGRCLTPRNPSHPPSVLYVVRAQYISGRPRSGLARPAPTYHAAADATPPLLRRARASRFNDAVHVFTSSRSPPRPRDDCHNMGDCPSSYSRSPTIPSTGLPSANFARLA